MALSSQRGSAVKNAIDDVVRRLEKLPVCGDVDELRREAEAYRREVLGWKPSMPEARKKEDLMKRVLQLHHRVAELERQRS